MVLFAERVKHFISKILYSILGRGSMYLKFTILVAPRHSFSIMTLPISVKISQLSHLAQRRYTNCHGANTVYRFWLKVKI